MIPLHWNNRTRGQFECDFHMHGAVVVPEFVGEGWDGRVPFKGWKNFGRRGMREMGGLEN